MIAGEYILSLENELGVSVEILSPTYAIISSDNPNVLNDLLKYKQIEYVEKPFILETQDTQSFSSTGITNFKNRRKQNHITFNDGFNQDDQLKMNGFNCDEFNCGCKNVVINHTVSYNFDTTIRDRIN